MGRLFVFALLFAALGSNAYAQNQSATTNPAQLAQIASPPQQATKPQGAGTNNLLFVLNAVRVEGTSLPPKILADATASYVGRLTDATAVSEIAQRVSDAYAKSDIAFYGVSVPAQDFNGGVLRLTVTEGYIEHIDLHGDTTGNVSRIAALAQKLTEEKPLHRSTLERCLSLIRDLPGVTIGAQVLPGDAPGAEKLSIGITRKKYEVALTLSNDGNALLGRVQAQADVSLYDLLRAGEETVVSIGTSTLFGRYQYYGLSHSEALDDDGTRASAGYSYLRTRVPRFSLAGDAQTLQFAVAHPFIRRYDENLTLGASLDGIDSSNALLGLAIANEDVRTARLSAAYTLTDPDWALSLGASVAQGIGIFGARTNRAISDAGFHKLVVRGSYNHLVAEDWVIRLRALAQLSGDKLPVSELYALGGPDFGRAFLTASTLGDSAAAQSLEIGYDPKGLPARLEGTELFGFADNGETWTRARPPHPALDANLASAGFGIRVPVVAGARLELQAANALRADAPGVRGGDWRFLFGITASY